MLSRSSRSIRIRVKQPTFTAGYRSTAPTCAAASTSRQPRKEGDTYQAQIGSVFASLTGEVETPLPARFGDLKRSMLGNADNQAKLLSSWKRLIERLAVLTPEIEKQQQECIPQVSYEEFVNHPSEGLVRDIKRCGTVVIRDTVSEDEALRWLDEIKAYIQLNPSVKGFPADDKQVFELYWSKPQLAARAHPRSVSAQRALLKLFSASPSFPISLNTPLTYADRLRIRHPGDAKFALGPHLDGGSVERWEDERYRAVYGQILEGDWEGFNAWQMDHRAEANQNMYDGAGACGVFRAFQGWTSLSDTGPNEGTLRVYPYLKEQTAYTLLRPLFRELASRASLTHEDYLSPDNWVLDTETTRFPGAPLGRGQELNDETHPHLQLGRSMVSIPRVRPGDQAWWHCDVVHAVESVHQGKGQSAVMYIPAVPLTELNARYVKDQRESFLQGIPPPDFPGGVGESKFEGRGGEGDISDMTSRNAMGLTAFNLSGELSNGEADIRRRANTIFNLS